MSAACNVGAHGTCQNVTTPMREASGLPPCDCPCHDEALTAVPPPFMVRVGYHHACPFGQECPPRPAAPDAPTEPAPDLERAPDGASRVAPDATAGDGLRSALIEFLREHNPLYYEDAVDELMAGPLRDVLAAAARDAERVRRCERLAAEFETIGEELHSIRAAEAYADAGASLRRALDGAP